MVLQILVEGRLDAAVAQVVIRESGHEPGQVFGRNGWRYIREKLHGFSQSAVPGCGLLALVDLMDTGEPCPGRVVEQWLLRPNEYAVLWVVVPRAGTSLVLPRSRPPWIEHWRR